MGFIIKKPIPQVGNGIITAKVSLREFDLLDPTFIYNIPEYPAVPGYFWNCIYMNGEIFEDSGSTPYIGITNIHIQAAAAPNVQFRFGGGLMTNAVGTWHTTIVTTILPIVYARNSQLQIHNAGSLSLGATGLNIYIGAILQEY